MIMLCCIKPHLNPDSTIHDANTWMVKAGGSEAQAHAQLHSAFEASQGYLRSWFYIIKFKQINKIINNKSKLILPVWWSGFMVEAHLTGTVDSPWVLEAVFSSQLSGSYSAHYTAPKEQNRSRAYYFYLLLLLFIVWVYACHSNF